jgi:superfamily II DNA or RNA helicase
VQPTSLTQALPTGETLRLAANAVAARLLDASREVKLAVSELLSYQVEGYERSEAFKARRWDGRSSFFDFRTGTFPAGFVPVVERELVRLGHSVRVVVKPPPEPLGPVLGSVDYLGFGFDPRYDYQSETVRRLLRHGRMIARVATGGGKSNIAVQAVGTIRRPTLFLTTRTVLAHQMAEGFRAAGFTPGFIGDGVWDPRRGVNIGMVQTFAARLVENHPDRMRTLALLRYFEVVIGEEAHEAGGGEYFEILQHCLNAHYRLALTATPFMRPDAEANMRLMAGFGPIGIDVSEQLLIERGILARPRFKIADAPAPPGLRRSTRWPACYDLGIVENPERNRVIVFEVGRAAAYGLPSLILINRRKHGEILLGALRDAGVKTAFIFGEHQNDERQRALRALASGELQALIGSTILDVGVDVPAVGLVVLAGGGKAEVAHRQRIGRGLRAKKTGPNLCHVLDFADAGNRTLQEHALTRRAILLQTPGFAENILPEGGDFDYTSWKHP